MTDPDPVVGITRSDAEALFAEAVAPNVVEKAIKSSVALATLPTVPMGTATLRIPVLSALPTGGFLNADQAVKEQSEAAWDKKLITAEEIAVIVPISETVIADSSIDVVSKVTELIGQEFGRVLDAAVFFGTGAPATFPTGGLFGAAGAQHVHNTGVLVDDLNDLFALVEDQDSDVTNIFGTRKIRQALRGQTDENGRPIYNPADSISQFGSIWGVPMAFPLGWDKTKADAIAIDSSTVVLGLRQDVTIKLLDQATLTGFGNLAEKDSVAIRAVMRVGFQVANPVSIESGTAVNAVGALVPAVVPPPGG